MLSIKQKNKLRSIKIFCLHYQDNFGIPIKIMNNGERKEIKWPTYDELYLTFEKKILSSGFTKVEKVKRNKANAIIRLAIAKSYKIKGKFYFISLAICYVREDFKFYTELNNLLEENFITNNDKMRIGIWLFDREKNYFDLDYYDYYVRVKA